MSITAAEKPATRVAKEGSAGQSDHPEHERDDEGMQGEDEGCKLPRLHLSC